MRLFVSPESKAISADFVLNSENAGKRVCGTFLKFRMFTRSSRQHVIEGKNQKISQKGLRSYQNRFL